MRKVYKRTIHDSEWKEVREPSVGCWLFYIAPSKDEYQEIEQVSGVPADTIEGSFDPYEYPRLERENGSVFFVFRIPVQLNRHMTTEPVAFMVTEQNIISVMQHERDFLANRLKDQQLFSTQKTNFLLHIILRAMLRYQRYLRDLNKTILMKKISIRQLSDEDIVSLVEVEETLTNFHSALVPLVAVLEKIFSGRIMPLFEKDKDLIEELTVTGKEIVEWCNVNLQSAANIREAHSTILANTLNRTMKFLASMTILFTIPNILGALFGMNVKLPFGSHPLAFWIVLGLAIVCVGFVFIVFWRKRWL